MLILNILNNYLEYVKIFIRNTLLALMTILSLVIYIVNDVISYTLYNTIASNI